MDNYIIGLLPTIEPTEDMKIAVGNAGGRFSITIGDLKRMLNSGVDKEANKEVSLTIEGSVIDCTKGVTWDNHGSTDGHPNGNILVNGLPANGDDLEIIDSDKYFETPSPLFAGSAGLSIWGSNAVLDPLYRVPVNSVDGTEEKTIQIPVKYKGVETVLPVKFKYFSVS